MKVEEADKKKDSQVHFSVRIIGSPYLVLFGILFLSNIPSMMEQDSRFEVLLLALLAIAFLFAAYGNIKASEEDLALFSKKHTIIGGILFVISKLTLFTIVLAKWGITLVIYGFGAYYLFKVGQGCFYWLESLHIFPY